MMLGTALYKHSCEQACGPNSVVRPRKCRSTRLLGAILHGYGYTSISSVHVFHKHSTVVSVASDERDNQAKHVL